jgi:hypothetical protein
MIIVIDWASFFLGCGTTVVVLLAATGLAVISGV